MKVHTMNYNTDYTVSKTNRQNVHFIKNGQ